MEPEYMQWLRDNMPAQMFAEFESDRLHGTRWRDAEIARLREALGFYAADDERSVECGILEDVYFRPATKALEGE